MYQQRYYKNEFQDGFDEDVFDLLDKLDSTVETLQFGNYGTMKKLIQEFLKLKRMAPMAVLASRVSSVLKIPGGAFYEIDMNKPIIGCNDHAQFTGNC